MIKKAIFKKIKRIASQGVLFLFVLGVFLYSGSQVLSYFLPLLNLKLKSLLPLLLKVR